MNRSLCIHGHFYQPPRENPWLEAIELQDSAYPYHDWNERITAECYATNATSRILDDRGRIAQIVNNYAKISFNFGPTLLAWLEGKAPDVYEAILEADRESRESFSGHGSAIAQIYNHLIMPLANGRDKRTQVIWGLKDFEYRFGRKPEGLWLSEAAVDLETLDILAEHGIRFTCLAPHQARRVRRIDAAAWKDVSGGKIDPKRPYVCHLPSGRTINLFFYDGPISQDIAFGKLLESGEVFARRLLSAFDENGDSSQLVHVATDGETYGHHHRFGEMALAYALHFIESKNLACPTNYGEYLEMWPPTHEVEILENTSWSCGHGVERWRGDCGCSTGKHPGWHQAWRAPLREALDWLRDTLAPAYEEKARSFFKDPWDARNDYVEVLLNRSRQTADDFLSRHRRRAITDAEKTLVLKLLELQRHAMLMYTSCGWFFDELSGIETVRIMQYAGRSLQLAGEIFGEAIEARFLERLEKAQSNIPEHGDGKRIYEKSVKPAMLDLERVGAHYALSSLFKEYPKQTSLFCYAVEREEYRSSEAGKAKLAVGHATLTSEITMESAALCFGVLHMGDHNLNCGVKEHRGDRFYRTLVQEVSDAFAQADFPKILRILDRHFGASIYSLRSLFRDEQRKILNIILESTLDEAEAAYRQLYEYHAPMMRFLKDLGIPPPKVLHVAAETVLHGSLRRAFESEELDTELVENLLREAQEEGISLDVDSLEYAFRRSLERTMERLINSPEKLSLLQNLESAVRLLPSLPFRVNLWKVQNMCYETLRTVSPEFRERMKRGDREAAEWVAHFDEVSTRLYIRVNG